MPREGPLCATDGDTHPSLPPPPPHSPHPSRVALWRWRPHPLGPQPGRGAAAPPVTGVRLTVELHGRRSACRGVAGPHPLFRPLPRHVGTRLTGGWRTLLGGHEGSAASPRPPARCNATAAADARIVALTQGSGASHARGRIKARTRTRAGVWAICTRDCLVAWPPATGRVCLYPQCHAVTLFWDVSRFKRAPWSAEAGTCFPSQSRTGPRHNGDRSGPGWTAGIPPSCKPSTTCVNALPSLQVVCSNRDGMNTGATDSYSLCLFLVRVCGLQTLSARRHPVLPREAPTALPPPTRAPRRAAPLPAASGSISSTCR